MSDVEATPSVELWGPVGPSSSHASRGGNESSPGRRHGYQPELCTERPELPQDSGEAIVAGAVGSAAPWFLTGWATGVEVEFMIDTGCQVTILATSVSEKMCVSDPRVRSRLRPCGRRLVSADSSPLTMRGELDMNVDFPGWSCDMILVVAEHWFGWAAGKGGFAVVFASSAGFKDWTIVGGGPVDAAVASTETGSPHGCSPDLFSSVAPG